MSLSKDLIKGLHQTGFATFNLKDLDVNLYNKLSDELKDGPHTLQHHLKYVRTKWLEPIECDNDYEFIYGDTNLDRIHHQTFDEGNERLVTITVQYDSINEMRAFCDRVKMLPNITIQQMWCFEIGEPVVEIKESIYNIFSKIIDTFYNKILDYENTTYELTWYSKDDIIYSHKDVFDGNLPDPVKLCSILLYLNKNYTKSDKGQLYVDNEKYVVYPEFGNVALLDYNKHALEHRVEPPTNEYGRYGVLSFIDLKNCHNKISLV